MSEQPRQTNDAGILGMTEGGSAPLSFAQQRLWLLDQLQPDSSVYNMTQIIRLKGSLNFKSIEAALNEVRRRHEILRQTFIPSMRTLSRWFRRFIRCN